MNDLKTLGRFAINANLDSLQDVFELEEAFDDIVGGLVSSPDVSQEVWLGLSQARKHLDIIRTRLAMAPMVLVELSPDSHKPETVNSA